MASFIIRRLIASIFVLFAATFLMYLLVSVSGDPLEDLRQSNAPNKAELMEARTKLLNLDVAPPLRYFLWLGGIFRGDFGISIQNQSVNALLGNAITSTLTLVTTATVVAIVLGITVGIVSALRQYTGFDYGVTLMSFLFFSLPIFWVAVLLKQYGAIQMNNWLSDPVISVPVIIGVALVMGLIWMSLLGGKAKRRLIVFGVSAVATGVVLAALSVTKWFADPQIGIVVYAFLAVGIAFGVTAISVGLRNRKALYASLIVAAIGIALYFPMMNSLLNGMTMLSFLLYAAATLVVSGVIGWFMGKPDRGPVVRTTMITGFLVAAFIALDKYMSYWAAYSASSRVRGRPIATVGASTPGLGGNFWVQGIDLFTHLLLPTIAIILISFASYTRYSRASLLEVMNQDYIRTARAKGLTQRTVVVRHAFRNALIPITTIIAFDIGALIGGAVITEKVFGWTGMGSLFVNALALHDPNPVMAFFVVTGTLAVIFNLIADLVYAALDPRIKVG
ncbi:ABC transporter permease [Microbacterium telephonicum]|uniref:Peptide/nickel transport system permease protein n=1 Tax=Microbacterium telephonicum TaxID=1714841 RepID=A0A498C1S6_9MICO|nr:ABC transporter permease [Microbacterium telephonicum]RLK49069.1 peptide/nickel transport system permease protein [Microbacterium telephonicum]